MRRWIGILCIVLGLTVYLIPQFLNLRLRDQARHAGGGHAAVRSQQAEAGGDAQSPVPRGEPETAAVESNRDDGTESEKDTGSPGEDLYERMEDYNRALFEEGQDLSAAQVYEDSPVDPGEAIGFIRIPDMRVELPLFIGASYEHLEQGAAVLGGSSMPVGGINTNCVISGHRSWCGAPYFRDIDLLKKGSLIEIYNGRETLVYRAFEKKIILPDETSAILIRPGKDLVTLITCHPYLGGGTHRYLVYCERDTGDTGKTGERKETDYAQAAEETKRLSSPEEEAPGGRELQTAPGADPAETERNLRFVVGLAITAGLTAVVVKRFVAFYT